MRASEINILSKTKSFLLSTRSLAGHTSSDSGLELASQWVAQYSDLV